MKIFKGFTEEEVKNDLICIYNEIKEARGGLKDAIHNFPDLYKGDDVVKALKLAIKRLENAEYWLRKYVDND